MSFVGGGTDMPSFYREHGGAVISAAINKYVYVSVNDKFDGRLRVSYSRTENVEHVDQIEHQIVRAVLRRVGVWKGVEITSVADVPSSGTGLGSSSAYSIGLLNALRNHIGQSPGVRALAAEACIVEIEDLGAPIGMQDQYACAFGGVNYLQFNANGVVDVTSVQMPMAVHQSLLLFYTGLHRDAIAILERQHTNNAGNVGALKQMLWLVSVLKRDLMQLGDVMHEAWAIKRSLAHDISNEVIDDWYASARKAGAIGGKILGAGGGGFLLLFAPPDRHEAIAQALPGLRQVFFNFDMVGSTILVRD